MDNNRPKGREKHVTSNSAGVHKRGDGLGTGPVGTGHGTPSGNAGRTGGPGRPRRSGGGGSPLTILIVLAFLLFGGGGGLMSMLGGEEDTYTTSHTTGGSSYSLTSGTSGSSHSTASGSGGSQVSSSSTSHSGNSSSVSLPSFTDHGTSAPQNNDTAVNTTVAKGARQKYTTIKGNGKDITTIMVYMCGTDLESKSGMASADIKEMANASLGNNINLIVYTGGCRSWHISGISTKTNQIYQVKDGKIYQLEADMGNKSMTDPATLAEFILYCKKNFPANRNDLILWDHGGGSVTGYGYDEKRPSAGAMNLSGIDSALKKAGMKFDFIGYDACLMAGAENALMLDAYADYMIASEETEPGIGWYYTKWLNAYGKNPSMDTVTIGKMIIDGFVEECASRCRGQQTTLSLVDLAEFSAVVPDRLKEFAKETADMIRNDQYRKIASARQNARDFARSTKIDQVDLVDLSNRLGTKSGKKLAEAILSAVKYNRTSTNMTNAYGVSIYFPNQKLSTVDTAIKVNNAIGMDEEYIRCIKEYASMQMSGQAVAQSNGNSGNPFETLIGNASYEGTSDYDMTAAILETLLGAGLDMLSGQSGSSSFFGGRSMSTEDTAAYIAENQLDTSAFVWDLRKDGSAAMTLTEDQWDLVTDLELNMFYDDGEGYIDLGFDTLYSFDDEGALLADTDRTWLAINGQPVAYYHETTIEDGEDYTYTGYVPVFLNGERAKLLLVFDPEHPYGYISGAVRDYKDQETLTIAKSMTELEEGDTLDFLCDYYSYEGEYTDTYYLGEPMEVTGSMEISNVDIGDGDALITYKFTDIYGQEYWTPTIKQ